MNRLTKQFFNTPTGIVTMAQVSAMVHGSDHSRHGLIKRAIANGEILKIRRGLYCLAPHLQRKTINSFSLAQSIYGPSYISLETALSYHGWIPEAVFACTNVSLNNARKFKTPVGLYTYHRVPQIDFYLEVERCIDPTGGVFFMATAAKALVDYLYVHKLTWTTIHEPIESMRLDLGQLTSLNPEVVEQLEVNYTNGRVKRFLAAWKKELVS